MSVHTWTYKKVSALTDEEKNKCVEEKLKDVLRWHGFKYTFNELCTVVDGWFKRQPELFANRGISVEEYATNLLNEYTNYLNTIRYEGFDGIVKIRDHYKVDFFEHNGELYYRLGCDIPFRCRAYSQDVFIDKESLINYLKQQDENMVGVYHDVAGFITDFDSVLNSINTFYEKHGENNLLIEFG